MFSLEGNEDGWFVVFADYTDQILYEREFTIFDDCELVVLYEFNTPGIRIYIDGERALGAIRKVADAFKFNLGTNLPGVHHGAN